MTDTVEAIVKTTLQAQILASIKSAPEVIDTLVRAALSQEVDMYGYKPDYNSKTKMPYLEYAVGDAIRQAARGAISEAVAAREEDIAAAVKNALTADNIVQAMIDRIMGALAADYRVQISFKDDPEKSRY